MKNIYKHKNIFLIIFVVLLSMGCVEPETTTKEEKIQEDLSWIILDGESSIRIGNYFNEMQTAIAEENMEELRYLAFDIHEYASTTKEKSVMINVSAPELQYAKYEYEEALQCIIDGTVLIYDGISLIFEGNEEEGNKVLQKGYILMEESNKHIEISSQFLAIHRSLIQQKN